MTGPPLLLVDDERNFREFLAESLEAEGYSVATAATARGAVQLAWQHLPQVVLLDQKLPDRSGLEIIAELRRVPSSPRIIVITAYAEYPRAVQAIKAGAFHYLVKPFEFHALLETLTQALDYRRAWSADREPAALAAIVGVSPQVAGLKRQVLSVASSPVETILLRGESGTGKELIARAIHALSERRERRMLSVNCAALTETLLMSELFGHERGAFTGARERKKGVFEAAQGGTLFLDEIGEMGPRAQAALLRVAEERTITRVGGTEEIPVGIRIVAATNGPLDAYVAEGRFRVDLYYRVNVIQIQVPPLRERGDDILLLAEHFAELMANRYGAPPRRLSAGARAALAAYSWPGNVRELRNLIERAYVVGSGPEITEEDVASGIRFAPPVDQLWDASTWAQAEGVPFRDAKERFTDRFERAYLEAALLRVGGNVSRAAENSGLARQAFQRLLKRHGLRRDDFTS